MVFNKVDVGSAPGDGSGDTVREAFEKVNGSFDDLAAAILARLAQYPGFAPHRYNHDGYVKRYLEDGPPRQAPPVYGALWIDVTSNKIYLATGTSSQSDWRELAFADGPDRP